MSFKDYAFSKAITLCIIGIGGILIAFVMYTAAVSFYLILMTEILLLMLVSVWLIINWYLDNKRLKYINKIMSQLNDKYLLAEVLPKPKSALEKQYYEIVKTVSRSAVGVANQAIREKDDYCEYVETWIHEIKTPLIACSLIIANDGNLQKIKRELKRADNLTENILYYARMKSSDRDLIIRKINIANILNQAVKSQMELLIASNISVEIEGDFEVYTDDKSVCFIIKQLLINCAKYCPGCQIKIYAKDKVVTVIDNGIGIPQYELSRVTERGFTGTNGRRLSSSTGMGLYIVKELCANLSIKLNIDSKLNQYTSISLKFK